MLNKWQLTATLLLTKEDFFATVIFVNDSKSVADSSEKIEKENVMRRTLLNNIKEFCEGNELCTVLLHVANDGIIDAYRDDFFGDRFVEYYWEQLCNCDGFRLKITKYNRKSTTLVVVKQ